jgi:hypothetical protein
MRWICSGRPNGGEAVQSSRKEAPLTCKENRGYSSGTGYGTGSDRMGDDIRGKINGGD